MYTIYYVEALGGPDVRVWIRDQNDWRKIDIDDQRITIVSSNTPSSQVKSQIRQRARTIEQDPSNSITNLEIKFDTR